MITRIVKMTFKAGMVNDFLVIFDGAKDKICAFDGCEHLELLRDMHDDLTYFTYSYWKDIDALESYRSSDLFTVTWAQTKVLFSERAKAWSAERVRETD